MNSRTLTLFLLVLFAFTLLAAVPVSAVRTAEQSVSDSLTRGSRFTVTITGLPNTSYYIWLPRTSSMTGEPYDQPPIIADYLENVQKDPAGGPYTIGSYQYNNGNGQTIIDDVAPSTATMSNTNYYALARTNSEGQAFVEFKTTLETGLRSYSVKVENPDSVNSDNLQVEATVYSRKAPSMVVFSPDLTPEQTPTPITTPLIITVTATPPPPTTQTTSPIPTTTQKPLTPSPTTKAAGGSAPIICGILIAALCIGRKR